MRLRTRLILRRWKHYAGGVLISVSPGACTSLPDISGRAPSTAETGHQHTKLAAAAQPKVTAHRGQSGIHLLPDGHDAFAARLARTDEKPQRFQAPGPHPDAV